MRVFKRAVSVCLGLAVVTSLGLAQETSSEPPNQGTQTAFAADRMQRGSPVEAKALNVVYENGQLSISAYDSTLKQILDAVRDKTGASLDVPEVLNIQHVAVELGPDDPQRVLGSLLYGTGLNYLVVGSVSRGETLKIVVMIHTEPMVQAQTLPVVAVAPKPPADAETTSEKTNGEEPSQIAENKDKKEGLRPDGNDKANEANKKDGAAGDKPDAATGDSAVAANKSTDGTNDVVDNPAAASATDRLAELPANINPAIAALYPSLFPGGASPNGNSSPSTTAVQPGTPIVSQTAAVPHITYTPGISLPQDAAGIPILPNNISPQMWGLYPPNLMQLISSNTQPPVVPLTSLAPGVPTTTTGQTVFWDQTLKGHP
jgi:hypothetical protein